MIDLKFVSEDVTGWTETEIQEEVDTTLYLKGRIGIDENDCWIQEIKEMNPNEQELEIILEGLIFAFKEEFGLTNIQKQIINSILEKS